MSTTLYSQDFEASTSPPSGWYFDAGYTIDATSKLSGANSVAVASTGVNSATYGTPDGVSGNATVGVEFAVSSPGASSQVRVFARQASATDGASDNYRANLTIGSAPGSWTLIRRAGGVETAVATSSGALNTAITAGTLLADGAAYRAYLTTNGGASPGTTLTLEVQRASDGYWLNGSGAWVAYRAYCMNATDAAAPIVGAGYCGFRASLASGATAYFDDFSIVDFVDKTTYVKTWADDSGFTSGVGTITPGLFSGGAEPGIVLPGDGTTRTITSQYNDRQYGNTVTGRVAFKLSAPGSNVQFTFRARNLTILFASSIGAIQIRDAANNSKAQALYLANQWVAGREYAMIFRIDGASARVAFRDTVTGNYLDATSQFKATAPFWALTWNMPAPTIPGVPFIVSNGGGGASCDLSVGPIKLGPCGTPQVAPSSATLPPGGTRAFVPLYFTGVDTVNSATAGTFSGNTYTAPGTAGAATATFVSPIGGESVDVPITVTSPATTYTLTGPAGGTVGVASTDFTVTPDAAFAGTITITPSGGGLSAPIVLTFSGSATPRTFSITPTAAGNVTLTPSNNGSLADPAALTYTSAVINATGYTLSASPATVVVGDLVTVTATLTGGMALSSSLVITLVDSLTSTISGKITIANGSTTGTATVTPSVNGIHLITSTHSGGGFSGGDGLTGFAANSTASSVPLATSYALDLGSDAPTVGQRYRITARLPIGTTIASDVTVSLAGTNLQYSATQAGALANTGTITISAGTGSGTAYFVPTSAGPVAPSATNGSSLTNPTITPFNASAAPITTASSYGLYFPPVVAGTPSMGIAYLTGGTPLGSDLVIVPSGSGVTLPATVTILAGQASVTFPFTVAQPGTATVSATHSGASSVTDPAPMAIAASAASSPGLGGLQPSGTPFTELLRGGLATVLDAVVAANPSLSQAAVAQVHDASGSSLDRAYRGLSQLVDSYIHGDPITQSEVNRRFADYVSVFTSVAQATSEIAAMIQASPGVLKTGSSSNGNIPMMTRTFS